MRNKADFGPAIVFLAERAGLSQKQLAKALKLHPGTISAWQRGKRLPNRRAMQALPGTLRCTDAEIDKVAAFHGEWRQKMASKQGRTAEDVKETRAEYQAPESQAKAEARHLEIGRVFDRLVELLSPDR
ncbi:MAG TPA: helix-turn-helix domain-containing protein [Thermoanaerobaculia bacterium]|nr:helix-turn-helix domain-containing protein [Thermoanaerobaculia bacterium]